MSSAGRLRPSRVSRGKITNTKHSGQEQYKRRDTREKQEETQERNRKTQERHKKHTPTNTQESYKKKSRREINKKKETRNRKRRRNWKEDINFKIQNRDEITK